MKFDSEKHNFASQVWVIPNAATASSNTLNFILDIL